MRFKRLTLDQFCMGFVVLVVCSMIGFAIHETNRVSNLSTVSALQREIDETDDEILVLLKKRQSLILRENNYNITHEAVDAKIVSIANKSLEIGLDRNVAVTTYYAMLSSFTELKLSPVAPD